MGALADLWKSERGLIAVALLIAATTLCGMAVITVQQWMDFAKWIFTTYAVAKTVTGVVAIAKSSVPVEQSTSISPTSSVTP